MNASDFISKRIYDDLIADIKNGKGVHYEAEKKVNGNHYRFAVHTDDHTLKEFGWLAGFEDHNYKCDMLTDGRSIGGGTVIIYDTEIQSYDDFVKNFNRRLSHFPDYTEQEQLSLW